MCLFAELVWLRSTNGQLYLQSTNGQLYLGRAWRVLSIAAHWYFVSIAAQWYFEATRESLAIVSDSGPNSFFAFEVSVRGGVGKWRSPLLCFGQSWVPVTNIWTKSRFQSDSDGRRFVHIFVKPIRSTTRCAALRYAVCLCVSVSASATISRGRSTMKA